MRTRTFLLVLLAIAARGAAAADPERGAALYQNHCTECHGSVAHQRDSHKADSWESLLGWVARWSSHLELGWTEAEREDVAAYLDRRFYGFGAGKKQ